MGQTVSVAMCTFNGERFISEQLQSILDQTTKPFEIVVVDDGSTDRTVEIIEQFILSSADLPISINLLKNPVRLGVTSNFEKAISATSGQYIFLADQDDIWQLDRIETYLNCWVDEPSTQLIFSDATLINAQGEIIGSSLFGALKITSQEFSKAENQSLFEVLIKRNIVTGATTALSRSLFDIATPFPKSWIHDEWLAIVAASLNQVKIMREQSIGYRQHDSNVIGIKRRTIRYWLGYFFASRAGRFVELNQRNSALQNKLSQIHSSYIELAEDKSQFDRDRTLLPNNRLLRIPYVIRNVLNGNYSRFASNGRPEAIRDLTQSV